MGRRDSIFGQIGETARCRDADLSATLRANLGTDLHKIFREGVE